MSVDVDPAVYYSAAGSANVATADIQEALKALASALSGSGGMAGSDNTGEEFGKGYDPAASDIATIFAGLIDMSGNAADLIRASGQNHAAANRASIAGEPIPASVPVPTRSTTSAPHFPSAYGGGGDEPSGLAAQAWSFIQSMVGYVWPNGSPEKLRAASTAWNTASKSIASSAGGMTTAATSLNSQKSDEVPYATHHLTDLKGKIDSLSSACSEAGKSCSDLADAIQNAHEELISELEQFAVEFLVTEIIVNALFEIGGSIWGQGIVAARAAALAGRCARIIEKLIELARAAARVIKAAGDKIRGLLEKIRSVIAAAATRSPKIDEEAARLSGIVDRYHSALDPVAGNMRTTSVLSTREGTDIIAGGKRDLTPAQRDLVIDGQQLAKNPNLHAEITALENARLSGLTPRQIVASRPICPECQLAIIDSGGTILPNGLGAVWP